MLDGLDVEHESDRQLLAYRVILRALAIRLLSESLRDRRVGSSGQHSILKLLKERKNICLFFKHRS